MNNFDECIDFVIDYIKNNNPELDSTNTYFVINPGHTYKGTIVSSYPLQNRYYQIWFRGYGVEIGLNHFTIGFTEDQRTYIKVPDIQYNIEEDYFQLSTMYPFSKEFYFKIRDIRRMLNELGVFEI